MQEGVTVVVLAGGKGTRLRGLYPKLPKPLVPVAGKPFLHWLTNWIASHGPSRFVYSTGYMADRIEAWSVDGEMPDLHRFCRREEEPLGTGGGLLNCLDLCSDWIMVANGDGLVMGGIAEMLALAQTDVDGGILGVDVPDTSRFGSLQVDDHGRLVGFAEKKEGAGLINGGLYIFRKSLLENFYRAGPVSIETELFPEMIAAGANLRVVARNDAPFIDIGTPETVVQAEAFIRTRVLRS
jgi:D-glycero-alpha-D-manno-heptose 1-phosphate guanylyltransferase